MPQGRCRVSIGVNAYAEHGASGLALCIVGQRSLHLIDICGTSTSSRGLTHGQRSAVRRVEEFILFDVLYEVGRAPPTAKYRARNSARSTETCTPRPISRPRT